MLLMVIEHAGTRIVEGASGSPLMRVPQDATLLIEACFSAGTHAALLYADNVTPRFFDLSSGEAGAVLDKLRRYHVRLAIVCPPGTAPFSRRFTELLADDLQAFQSRDEACAWLSERERR